MNPPGTAAACIASVLIACAAQTRPPMEIFPAESRLAALEIGLDVPRAEAALGVKLQRVEALVATDDCAFVSENGAPSPFALLVSDGQVARIDIRAPGLETAAGIEVGSSRAAVVERFGSRLEPQPDPYDPDGERLILRLDERSRVVFEMFRGSVDRIVIGRLPEVTWLEGCA